MHLRYRALIPLAAAVLVALPTAGAHAASGNAWTPDFSVPPGDPALANNLEAVDAVAPDDVWAVGAGRNPFPSTPQVLHYDGVRWVTVPTPAPARSWLWDVDAVSATDVWAIGGAAEGHEQRALLLRRVNGAFVSVPVSSPAASLAGIHLRNPWSGWIVGSQASPLGAGHRANLALRWDGSSWRSVPTPDAGPGLNILTAVVADGPTTAWAVGSYTAAGQSRQVESVILRWNGTRWSRVATPNPASDGVIRLAAVTATSPNDAWAVGQDASRGWTARRPIALHWDGKTWTQVPLDAADSRALEFTDVAALSATEAYFVGYRNAATNTWDLEHDTDLVRRWDGTRFVPEAVDLPRENPSDTASRAIVSALSGVSVLPTGHLWAVGHVLGRHNHVLHRRP